jgi:hypothetical protein
LLHPDENPALFQAAKLKPNMCSFREIVGRRDNELSPQMGGEEVGRLPLVRARHGFHIELKNASKMQKKKCQINFW